MSDSLAEKVKQIKESGYTKTRIEGGLICSVAGDRETGGKVTIRIYKDQEEPLKQIAEELGIKYSQIFRLMADDFIEKYNQK